MADQPSSPQPDQPPPGGQADESLNVAVLRSLSQLAGGNPAEFSEHEWPPPAVLDWVAQADRRQLHGLLISTLRRWHKLRREELK